MGNSMGIVKAAGRTLGIISTAIAYELALQKWPATTSSVTIAAMVFYNEYNRERNNGVLRK